MAEDDYESSAPDAAPAEGQTKDARRYLDMIKEAEAYFEEYQTKADNVDKFYADLERMANTTREREMQVFWANLEVLKPSIYARPPVPVVVPRFKDRKPLPRRTAEMLERAVTTSFASEDIDATMRAIRDDLAVNARGVVWVRYEKKDGDAYECVRYDHLERRDFLHNPARKWREVWWVARRAWLNRKDGLKRFGDVWLGAAFTDKQGEEDKLTNEQKAPCWELWDENAKTVVWVTPGVEELLDESEPETTLEGFFPCPRPAYGTLQRRTLKPVPDFVYYKDQIEEINELTARISALAEGLRLKGFYAAGASEVGTAVEAALKDQSNNAVLVPISNFAALGGAALKDAIVWLPVRDVAEVIKGCIELRRQMIEDVYQVTGLSDIMRGATDPNETLGAQELKSQYGSIRIRDRQNELVRIARDMTRIAAEIMAENFSPKTLLEMTQLEVATDAEIAEQVKPLEAKGAQIAKLLQAAENAPAEIKQAVQSDPQKAEQVKGLMAKAAGEIQSIQKQLGKLKDTPTIEQMMALLRSERVRPFVLDIETDSTIAPDENAQKQRATEFVTATGGFMGQVVPMVQQVPQLATLAGAFLKYVAGQFRAGRELEGVIDEFADQMAQSASQPQTNPEAEAAAAKIKAEQAALEADLKAKQQDEQLKGAADQRAQQAHQQDTGLKAQASDHQTQLRERETGQKMQQADQAHAQAMELGRLAIVKLTKEIERLGAQMVNDQQKTEASITAGEAKTSQAERAAEAKAQQPVAA